MSYSIFITRAESSLDSVDKPITKQDWDAIVNARPDLDWSKTDYMDRKVKGVIERIYAVNTTGKHGAVLLWLIDGAIEVKNPEQETIAKMVEIATLLNAKVIGEENEVYGPDGEPI